ncbi:MAG TPA: metallopeptidase TldD-related protein [Gemmatimonadaceae bacterium]|nr:metallopeptidase TldD-related protein [Gemmatimonadaceae bacterium]
MTRIIRGAVGGVSINELDDASLRAAVAWAERHCQDQKAAPLRRQTPLYDEPYPKPAIFSQRTYAMDPPARIETAVELMRAADAAGMLAAGRIEVGAHGVGSFRSNGLWRYYQYTSAEYEVRVRDPEGTTLGWAGRSSTDWERLNAKELTATALQKCLESRNPAAIEPGRYTTILEPQAAYDALFKKWRGFAPWGKLHDHVVDARLSVSQDPMDPDLATLPFEADGSAYRAVTWIDHGAQANLPYGRDFALEQLHQSTPLLASRHFRVTASEVTSMEEMIATTRRGLLVTAFEDVEWADRQHFIVTSPTYGGVWLIENGKVTKPVKNLVMVESMPGALNNIEQIGPSVKVLGSGVVPALKIRDFSFTRLADVP